MMLKHFFSALIVTLLCACSPEQQECVSLPGTTSASYCLQPTQAVAPFSVQQFVELQFAGKKDALVVDLDVDAARMQFVALTPFGQKLIHVDYDNRQVNAYLLPHQKLPPALLLSLLQLASWPADSVRVGLEVSLRLEESGEGRRILHGDDVLVEVTYHSREALSITLPAPGLEITIRTLEGQ